MKRTDIYLKVTVDHDPLDTPEKLAGELCRLLERYHGVRAAALQNYVEEPD
jgi:hypothetical protein